MGARMEPLGDKDVVRMTAAFSGELAARNRAMFVLGISTGYRVSELLSLGIEVAAMSMGDQVPRVEVARRLMKARKRGRSAPLNRPAMDALRAYWETLPHPRRCQGFPLFQGVDGRRMSSKAAYRAIRSAAVAAGVAGKVGTHSMRKTYARRVYQRCLDRYSKGEKIDPIRTVQKALGHSSVATTEAYMMEPTDPTGEWGEVMAELWNG